MNRINLNIGLIVLSVSIVVSSILLTKNKMIYRETSNHGLNRIELTGNIVADPIRINTNSNNMTYNSELKIAEGEQLFVKLLDGVTETISGENVVAKYFHASKLLTVTYKLKEKKMIRYFNSPITWGNKE